MFKKASIAIFSTLLAVGTVAGFASAKGTATGIKGDHDGRKRHMMIGQITSLGSDNLTFDALDGDTHTLSVDAETFFKQRDGDPGDEITLTELSVGDWIGIYAKGDLAKMVVLLPDDFDPQSLEGRKAAGEIQMVSSGADFFKLETQDGETLTISIDEATRYSGSISSFEDLEEGLLVGVLTIEQSDGSLLAKAVATRRDDRPQLDRTGGTISAVDGNSITIIDRETENHEFTLNEETRIGSRDKSIETMADLKIDLPVIVLTDPEAEPETAVAVMVLDEAILNLDRAGGKITRIDEDSLTIEKDGSSLTFSLTEDPNVRGREIGSLEDLEVGQIALVLYRTEADGSLTAVGIGIGRPGGPGR